MAYIGKAPASSPITASDIADGIISTAKIANDAIDNTKLDLASNFTFTGDILTTNKPSFFAYGSSNDWVGFADNATITSLNTTVMNVGSDYNTSNGKFTVPTNGIYFFSFNFYIKNTDNQGHFKVAIDGSPIGGSTYHRIRASKNDADNVDETISLSWVYQHTANQEVTIQSAYTTCDIVPSRSYFSGFLIG